MRGERARHGLERGVVARPPQDPRDERLPPRRNAIPGVNSGSRRTLLGRILIVLTSNSKTANISHAAPRPPSLKSLKWVGGSKKGLDGMPEDAKSVFGSALLDVFLKKSKSGIGTPQADKDRVRQRYKAARQHYDDNYRKHGEK